MDSAVAMRPRLPLFRFGDGDGSPLSIISGGLILDTGEAERTFVYRCQDRFLAYSSLLGLHTVFFAVDEAHVATYRRLIARVADRFERISVASGLFSGVRFREPLFVIAAINDLHLRLSQRFTERLHEAGVRSAVTAGIAMNQVSPTYAKLAADLEALLALEGLAPQWHIDDCRQVSEQAMRAQDKACYTDRIRAEAVAVERHLPTLIIEPERLRTFRNWEDLSAVFESGTGHSADALFAKTSRNSAGNLATRIHRDSMRSAVDSLLLQMETDCSENMEVIRRLSADLALEVKENPALRTVGVSLAQLEGFKLEQARQRHGISVLLQPELVSPPSTSRPAGIGLSFQIAGPELTSLIAVSAQIYRDVHRRHFLGAYLSPAIRRGAGEDVLADAQAICTIIAADGYRGPVNFDATLDETGSYRFVHDCNPRLTGVFPSLAVETALFEEGRQPSSVLTLGYRGEFVFPDLDRVLARLSDAGLLYGGNNDRGAVLLPNLCRDDGYDLHLIGISPDEASDLLNGTLRSICGDAIPLNTLFA